MTLPLAPTYSLIAAALVCTASQVAYAKGESTSLKTYNLPGGDAVTTLKRFATESGEQIVYLVENIRGQQTNAVVGDFSAREALDRMLAGTVLVASQDPVTGAIAIGRKRPPPTPPSSPGTQPAPPQTEHSPVKKPNLLIRTAAWLAALGAPLADAQVNSSSLSSDQSDKVVELSPFQVTTDDAGYQASNALSGTRLNTKLEDIASATTVVTKQQLLDTAVNDINDLFLYEASTEGLGSFTAVTINRDGGVNDDAAGDPNTANRIRGMNATNIAIGNFVSNRKVPFDVYNIDSVEISRGANSNLFGLGAGSGVVNLVRSAANVQRRSVNISTRADDTGGVRGSFDFNQPLIANKLAIRVSGVAQNKAFEREPSFDDTRRLYGAITWKPTKTTTLRLSGEHYTREAQIPNYVTPRDFVSDWVAYGRPAWDPTTFRVTYANGTTTGTFPQSTDNTALPWGLAGAAPLYTRGVLYVQPDGQVSYWSVGRTGNAATPLTRNQNVRVLQSGSRLSRERSLLYPLFFDRGVTDKSVYDWSSINYIAPNYTEDKSDMFVGEWEQILIESRQHLLASKVGWFHQEFERYNRNMIVGNDTIIYVDPNSKLIDGTTNPNFGRPYVGATAPIVLRQPEDIDTMAVDLAYQWTPSRNDGRNWIGQQRFNFHGEHRRTENINYRYRDIITSTHSWTNTANRTSSPETYYQYYLGDATGYNVDYAPTSRANLSGNYPFYWYNGASGQQRWVSESATLGEAAITGTNVQQQKIDTYNITYQGTFLDGRVLPTLGWRRDRQQGRNSSGVAIDPATGWIDYQNLNNFANEWTAQSGETKTLGIVVKPTTWLNLFYNFSDSFDPLGIAYNIFGDVLPNPSSKGKDWGVAFKLLNGKLFIKVNRYDNTEVNSRRSQIGTIGSRIHRLEGWRQPYTESLYPWAVNVVTQRFLNQGITQPTDSQIFNAAAAFMQIDPDQLRRQNETGAVYVPADVTSKGWEIEATYNPTRNWRIKGNLAQVEAYDSNIGADVTRYLDERMAVWTSLRDDEGNRWWDFSNGAPRGRYIADILAPYSFEVANSGKPRPQLREWRMNLLTNYDFVAGRFKNWSIGGALRWESKGAIGYYGMPPDADGLITNLDPNRPIYDKARYKIDLNASYKFKLLRDKVRGKVQLNVRDLFEDGRLQAIAVNPDGSPYAFRIIDPRQFIVSTSFEF
ncbi:MAG TPA: TonB-dependent receptor [Opitutaceae bacterium]|nr:TonB-dependent receptor [Opitutaceae bacterium]